MKKYYLFSNKEFKATDLSKINDSVETGLKQYSDLVLMNSNGIIYGLNITQNSSGSITISSGAVLYDGIFGMIESTGRVINLTVPTSGSQIYTISVSYLETLDTAVSGYTSVLVTDKNRTKITMDSSTRRFGSLSSFVRTSEVVADGEYVLASVTLTSGGIAKIDGSNRQYSKPNFDRLNLQSQTSFKIETNQSIITSILTDTIQAENIELIDSVGNFSYDNSYGLLFNRNSVAPSGNVSAPEHTPRIINNGICFEPEYTNFLLNSDTPISQSITLVAGTYTFNMVGEGSVELRGSVDGYISTVSNSGMITFKLNSTNIVSFTIDGVVTKFSCTDTASMVTYLPILSQIVTKKRENCQIYYPQNELKYSAELQKPIWESSGIVVDYNGDYTSTINTTLTSGYISNNAQCFTDATRTFFVKLKGGTFVGVIKIQLLSIDGNTLKAETIINTTELSNTEYKTFTVSSANDGNDLRCRIYYIMSTDGHFFVGKTALTQGILTDFELTNSVAVHKSSTLQFPDDVEQNGFIEFDSILPSISNGKTYYIFGNQYLGLYRNSTTPISSNIISFVNSNNGNGSEINSFDCGNIWDGLKHSFKIEWRNYTLNGLRYMQKLVYIDDVLKYCTDVSSISNATLWSPKVALSISDGDVFGTISNVKFGFPSLPEGSVAQIHV